MVGKSAELLSTHWPVPRDTPPHRDSRGGSFHAYLPDYLISRPLVIDGRLGTYAAEVESAVWRLSLGEHASSLEHLARFFLRAEAIASSRIEGLRVSAQQVALAELALTEGTADSELTQSARLVADNIAALHRARTVLADMPTLTVEGIWDLHAALLPDEAVRGPRKVQNWIGGNDWHPLDAQFVPPPAEHVIPLMDDLVTYASGGVHAPLVQAALVHAQFETIHPFADGNGRVGRALIHTVLTRRGLTRSALLPVSLVLLSKSDSYVDGLSAYRYMGAADGPAATIGTAAWLTTFLEAVAIAAERVRQFVDELDDLREQWRKQHERYRSEAGMKTRPRADSAVARLLEILPEAPVVITRTVERLLGVSFTSARSAVEELAEAKILSRNQVGKGTTGYSALDVFDLLTFTERRMASTKWDTRQSTPRRATPAVPQR